MSLFLFPECFFGFYYSLRISQFALFGIFFEKITSYFFGFLKRLLPSQYFTSDTDLTLCVWGLTFD